MASRRQNMYHLTTQVNTMNMLKAIKTYFELMQDIYDHFGFEERDRRLPLDDCTDDYWFLTGEQTGGVCVHCDRPLDEGIITKGDDLYVGRVRKAIGHLKPVYRTDYFTMASVDTQVNDNILLMIFSNDKECKDRRLIHLFFEIWGSTYA